MSDQYIVIDKVKWWILNQDGHGRYAQPLCPIHNLRLRPVVDTYSYDYNYLTQSHTLKCEDCKDPMKLPRNIENERQYILDKIDAKFFKSIKFINLDDEAIPIAEDKAKSTDRKYFVTSRLMESKTGLRLVVYAGERGKKEKTEIFIEPEIKRLAFDQADLHPTDVFTKLEATFNDGTKATQKKK